MFYLMLPHCVEHQNSDGIITSIQSTNNVDIDDVPRHILDLLRMFESWSGETSDEDKNDDHQSVMNGSEPPWAKESSV